MIAPKTYAEWSELLNRFKNKEDDDEVINAMKNGTIEWQSGVAERFSKKLLDAFNFRMNAASDKFQQNLIRTRGEEGAIVQAVLALRKEMSLLADAINIPAIPEEQRTQYVKLIKNQADQMQQSLEDSAKKDRSGKMSNIIRNHKVNNF